MQKCIVNKMGCYIYNDKKGGTQQGGCPSKKAFGPLSREDRAPLSAHVV